MEQFGYIKVSRKMFAGDPFWDEERQYSRAEAWVDLIQMASWKDRKQVVGATVVHLERGELLASERFLSERWQWSRGKVRRFLDLLEKMDRISKKTDHQTDHPGTVVSICNYDTYQSGETTNGPPVDRERTTNGPPADQREGSKDNKGNNTSPSLRSGDGADRPALVDESGKLDRRAFRAVAIPLIRANVWQGKRPPDSVLESEPGWNEGREANVAMAWITEGTADADTVIAFLESLRTLPGIRDGPLSLLWLHAREHRSRLYELLHEVKKRMAPKPSKKGAGPLSLAEIIGVRNAA